MADLGTLRECASRTARFRGHNLKWQAPHHGEHHSYQLGECSQCDCYVCITTRPMPNEIDIGGDALAITCKDNQRKRHHEKVRLA